MVEIVDIHWRHTQKSPKLLMFDARLAFFILVLLFYPRLWTFIVFVVVMAFFWTVEQFGYSMPSAFRAIRAWLLGNDRPAQFMSKRRYMIDYNDKPIRFIV